MATSFVLAVYFRRTKNLDLSAADGKFFADNLHFARRCEALRVEHGLYLEELQPGGTCMEENVRIMARVRILNEMVDGD